MKKIVSASTSVATLSNGVQSMIIKSIIVVDEDGRAWEWDSQSGIRGTWRQMPELPEPEQD